MKSLLFFLLLVPILAQANNANIITNTNANMICNDSAKVTASTTNVTVTITDAAFCAGSMPDIERLDNNPQFTVTVVSGNPSVTFDGLSSVHLDTQGESWAFSSDGTNYEVVNHYAQTAPQSFTMTIGSTGTAPTLGTVTTNNALWWRIGKYLYVQYTLSETGGSNGSGTYLFPLPFGAMDTSAFTVTPSVTNFFGRGTTLGNGVISNAGLLGNSYNAVLQAYDSTHLFLGVPQQGVLGSLLGGLGSTSQAISFTAAVPMSGWEP